VGRDARAFPDPPARQLALTTIGVLGIIVELRTPGFGAPGALGILSLGLFFWGHWLARLAGWEEVLLVAVGLVLLTVEVFVTPGFGLAGTLGLLALVGGLGLSLVGAGATWSVVLTALGQIVVTLLLAIAASLAMLRFLPRLPFGRRLILETELDAREGFASAPEADRMWLGKRGTAASTLRPASIATFEGDRVDVVSDGEFIDPGDPITVVKVDGNRIVVRQLH
jgi:membrane-bound serine protease (ClpP class)